MVKFGKHQQFFLEQHDLNRKKDPDDDAYYTVPYDDFKHQYIPKQLNDDDDVGNKENVVSTFQEQWRDCLYQSSSDFQTHIQRFWKSVFQAIAGLPASRGAVPDQALRLFLETLKKGEENEDGDDDAVTEMYVQLQELHSIALLNAEALRKLVKKFDKHVPDESLSGELLPDLYSSKICMALPTIENGLSLIRNYYMAGEHNVADGEEEEAFQAQAAFLATQRRLRKLCVDFSTDDMDGFVPISKRRDSDAALIDKRNSELQWLHQLVSNFPDPDLIVKLVGHRGFHSVRDRSDRRPIENSLVAYEACWTNGIHLCECDIALTKDERIILCHDETFQRLALDPKNPLCQKSVRELTYREIISLPLKSGVRPPLLFDVLRSADAIGGGARMIVEIKPGNIEAGTALARMFARHPDLMTRVAVVMSFDAFAMHQFRKELMHVMDHLWLEHQQQQQQQQQNKSIYQSSSLPFSSRGGGHHRKLSSTANLMIPNSLSIGMSLEDLAAGAIVGPSSSIPVHKRIDSTDHFGVGMSMSSFRDFSSPHESSFHPFLKKPSFKGEAEIHTAAANDSSLRLDPLIKRPNWKGHVLDQDSAGASLNTLGDGSFGQFANLAPIPADEMASGDKEKDDSQQQEEDKIFLYRPKLLLITVCEQPKKDCELQVSVKDFSRIDNWLRGGPAAGSLDGVYLQYEPEMLTTEGISKMQELTSKYDVGIWGANPEPDDYETFSRLCKVCGVNYVNSSLPRRFVSKSS